MDSSNLFFKQPYESFSFSDLSASLQYGAENEDGQWIVITGTILFDQRYYTSIWLARLGNTDTNLRMDN
jgi:hypothetical protein